VVVAGRIAPSPSAARGEPDGQWPLAGFDPLERHHRKRVALAERRERAVRAAALDHPQRFLAFDQRLDRVGNPLLDALREQVGRQRQHRRKLVADLAGAAERAVDLREQRGPVDRQQQALVADASRQLAASGPIASPSAAPVTRSTAATRTSDALPPPNAASTATISRASFSPSRPNSGTRSAAAPRSRNSASLWLAASPTDLSDRSGFIAR
jgi:hypothetical protein